MCMEMDNKIEVCIKFPDYVTGDLLYSQAPETQYAFFLSRGDGRGAVCKQVPSDQHLLLSTRVWFGIPSSSSPLDLSGLVWHSFATGPLRFTLLELSGLVRHLFLLRLKTSHVWFVYSFFFASCLSSLV